MNIRTLTLLLLLLLGTRVAGAQGFVVSGVMHHVSIEGGCWYLQANGDGKRYELWADSATLAGLHKEGLRATLRLERARAGAASICMVGDIARVLSWDRADTGRASTARTTHDLAVNEVTLSGTLHREASGQWYLASSTAGRPQRYAFEVPPAAKLRKEGHAFRARVRLTIDRSVVPDQMDGLILAAPEKAPHRSSGARKLPAPDPR